MMIVFFGAFAMPCIKIKDTAFTLNICPDIIDG